MALADKVVLHTATGVVLVVVAFFGEHALHFVDGCRVLEGAVGEVDHDDGYHVFAYRGHGAVAALAVGARAVGVDSGCGAVVLRLRTSCDSGDLLRIGERTCGGGELIACALCGFVGQVLRRHNALALQRGIAQSSVLALRQDAAVARRVVVKECVALFRHQY